MNKSESIKELSTALTKAQSQMSGAKKKAANPFFKSKYANLEEVIHCIKEPFADNGLSFVQFPISSEGAAGVETIIMHESGEWISNEFLLKCAKNDPQGMGSAITYARRYGLQAAVGVPSEDDDGEGAMKRSQPKKAAPKPEPMTDTQKDNIATLIDKNMLTDDQIAKANEWASGGATSLSEQLTKPQAAKLIKFLTDKLEASKAA